MRVVPALLVALALATPALAQEQIAITFDDLPSHSALPLDTTRVDIAKQIIAALKDAKAPAYGFVNGLRLQDDAASAPVLQLWRDAGFPFGNHTYSHMNLNRSTLEDWEADTLKNESVVAPLMADGDWHWLRFPYLAEGDTVAKHDAVRAFLAAHGYRIAAVTLSFDDYYWNEPYARCVAKGDKATIAAMETAYLAAAGTSLRYYHVLSQELYGRDIPSVLLMHLGAFDARMLPRLLALYKANAVSFISLAQAEADPFYSVDADLRLPAGPTTLEQAMEARGITYYPARVVQVMPFDTLCR
jgi:peptidoglycan/xylan/chitin deacetylase (PgdA/CDA1 family)